MWGAVGLAGVAVFALYQDNQAKKLAAARAAAKAAAVARLGPASEYGEGKSVSAAFVPGKVWLSDVGTITGGTAWQDAAAQGEDTSQSTAFGRVVACCPWQVVSGPNNPDSYVQQQSTAFSRDDIVLPIGAG